MSTTSARACWCEVACDCMNLRPLTELRLDALRFVGDRTEATARGLAWDCPAFRRNQRAAAKALKWLASEGFIESRAIESVYRLSHMGRMRLNRESRDAREAANREVW